MECYDYSRDLTGHSSFATIRRKRGLLRARQIMLTHMNPTMLQRTAEAVAEGFLVAEDGLTVAI
jgi:phosphoribosyl 1,2-cyclic phosphodiesterase